MKKIKFLLLSLSAIGFLNSCIVEDEDPKVDAYASSPLVVGFNKASESFSYFENTGAQLNNINVEVVGGALGFAQQDTNVSFEIDPSSTAVEGVEFSLPNGKNITIAANRDLVNFPISVNTGNLNPTEATFVTFNIVNNSSAIASPTKKSITINFVGCISQIQTGAYTYTRVGGSTAVPATGTANFTQVGVNKISFNYPSATIGGQPIPIIISDVCGDLSFSSPVLAAIDYEFVYDSASFDSATNTIVINNMRLKTNTGGFAGLRGNVTYVKN